MQCEYGNYGKLAKSRHKSAFWNQYRLLLCSVFVYLKVTMLLKRRFCRAYTLCPTLRDIRSSFLFTLKAMEVSAGKKIRTFRCIHIAYIIR